MNARLKSQFLQYAAIFFFGVTGSAVAGAQTYGVGAGVGHYLGAYRLHIPALKVGDKYYDVRLTNQWVRIENQAPFFWTLEEVLRTPPVEAEYLSGTYQDDVVDLPCVGFLDGNLYSAQLAATSPGAHTFALKSYRKIAACPKPSDIGPVRGQWVRTAEHPLTARADASLSWTGSEIVVLGGTDRFSAGAVDYPTPAAPPFKDGAAYNPATNTWRKIADAPAPIAVYGTASVGSSVFVLATTDYKTLRLYIYRAAEDTWDKFALPALPTSPLMTAVGSKLLLYSSSDEQVSPSDWLVDPASGEWTQLPQDPLDPSYSRTYVVHGTDLYLFARYFIDLPGVFNDRFELRAARWREQRWTSLPHLEDQPEVGISTPTLIAGQRLIAPSLDCDTGDYTPYDRCRPYGVVFDTQTDSWQELPDAPGGSLRFFASGGGLSASQLLLGQPGSPALDATTNTWFLVPRLDAYENFPMRPRMAAMGSYGFAFGGGNSLHQLVKDSWIWKP